MKSKTKSSITAEQVKKIAQVHFPDASIERVVELTDGMFNTAFLIEGSGKTADGVVLKTGPVATTETLTYEKDILRTEVEVYRLLKNKPIPVPVVFAHDFSRNLIACDYFFMEKVQGQTWKSIARKIPQDDRSELMRELGRYNAAVHSVEGGWFGYIKNDKRFRYDSWSKAFCGMMNDIMNDGRERGYTLPYEEIYAALKKHQCVLDEISIPKLVDFDMWAGNVFISRSSRYQISGVVDFERCFFGDPFADFTSAMMLFDDVEKEKDFQCGYNEVSGKPFIVCDNDRIRMNLYRLYMAVIMMVETYRYNKAYAMVVKGYFKSQINKILKTL